MTTLDVAYDQFGATGPPVVVLHGLLGSARNWTGIAKHLAGTRRVFALDLRNHGRSPWADTMSFEEMAGDVAAFIERQELSAAAVIGHSLGGKVAMRLALTRAGLVERLVVVDVAPVAYAHAFGPFVEAMREVDLAAMRQRTDADLQLERRIPDAVVRNFLLQNLIRTDAGYAWRVNLEALAANMPELLGFPTPPDGAAYRGPTLFVAGGRSPYIKAEHRPLIERLFPHAEHEVIRGAGHWVQAERPTEFLACVQPFLR
ncbi:MAG TPA: alpha/beta fold hydrolase [Geminicoccaceae bacterium]